MSSDLTLYGMVEDEGLLSLLARVEEAHSQEERAEAEAAVAGYTSGMGLRRKVDAYSHLMSYFTGQIQAADSELARLTERKGRFARAKTRLESMALLALHMVPEKAGRKQLEGEHATLTLRENPPHVVLTNVAVLPDRFVRAEILMEMEDWRRLSARIPDLPFPCVVDKVRSLPMINMVREALLAGEEVPGAELDKGFRVERK